MQLKKIKFPFKCPVCGKEEFDDLNWLINEAKESFVEKRIINPKYKWAKEKKKLKKS